MYKFDEQLSKGQAAEKKLDSLFSDTYVIQEAEMKDQRRGIDRFFVSRKLNTALSVEYKTDWRAAKTGNAFVETVSVDTQNKPGWAKSSQADYLVYYVPDDELVYVMKMKKMREHLNEWMSRYPERKIPNQGYSTIGVLVPLKEFEKHAEQVLSL